jgi:hypothetical protein
MALTQLFIRLGLLLVHFVGIGIAYNFCVSNALKEMRPQDVFNPALIRLGFSLSETKGNFSQMLLTEQTSVWARGYLCA